MTKRKKTKTIADHLLDVLIEAGRCDITRRDTAILDECARRCTHTTLMDAHPPRRYTRVLDALGGDRRFEKSLVQTFWWNGNGYVEKTVRHFELAQQIQKGDS